MTVTNLFLIFSMITNIVLFIHIINNKVFTRNERFWFSMTVITMTLCSLLEWICSSSAFAAAHTGLFSFLLMLEFSITPLPSPFKCFAYGQKKAGSIIATLCFIYFIVIIIAYFSGNYFQVDASGNYSEGKAMLITSFFGLFYTLYDVIILYQIGKKFYSKDNGTLIGIWLLVLIMICTSFLTGSTVLVSSSSFVLLLMYVYYDGLKQKDMQSLLQRVSVETIEAVVNAIDAKDEYTKGHSSRVAAYSKLLAQHLGYQGDRLNRLYYAAILHDVGKIGIPDSVLNKTSRLDDIEFLMMREHAIRGGEIAKKITLLPEAYDAARSHHERYDGKGYPDKLSEKNIPEIARIIGIADTYDAMNSDRIYRKALPRDVIRKEMLKGKGTQFDPQFLEVFIELMDKGDLDKVAQTARKDMLPAAQYDQFTNLSKDILEFFTLKYEFTGKWDETFDKWERLKDYIKKITEEYKVSFELVVVSIKPTDKTRVSQEQQEKAITTMKSTAERMLSQEDVCARISLTQIALIYRSDDLKDLSTTMKDILIYFYKIFESEPFSIGYYVIDSELNENKASLN